MKNRKMSSAITATVLLVNLVCIILFYLIANTTLTSLMKKSALKNLHTSLDVQTEIAKEYIRHQEDMLTTFSDSDVVRAFLKDPQNEQKKDCGTAIYGAVLCSPGQLGGFIYF